MLLKDTLDQALAVTRQALEARSVVLFLERKDSLVPVAHSPVPFPCPLDPVPLAEEGVLSVAMEKGSFYLPNPQDKGFRMPYTPTPGGRVEEVLAGKVPGEKAVLVAEAPSQGSFSENRQKLFGHLVSLIGAILKDARTTRERLLDSGKYLVLEEATRNLLPARTVEALQEGFSALMATLDMKEALVVSLQDGRPRALLAYGPLSVSFIGKEIPVRGTPWEEAMKTRLPWCNREKKPVPFIGGLQEGRFPAVAMVPLERSSSFLGMASEDRRNLGPEILDLLVTLGDVLDSALCTCQEKEEDSLILAGILAKKLKSEVEKGNATLVLACKVKNLPEIDRKDGLAVGDSLLKTLSRLMAEQMEGRTGIFRGGTVIGYRSHSNAGVLAAVAKAVSKNLPLSLPEKLNKAQLEVGWEVVPPFEEEKVDETLTRLVVGSKGKAAFPGVVEKLKRVLETGKQAAFSPSGGTPGQG